MGGAGSKLGKPKKAADNSTGAQASSSQEKAKGVNPKEATSQPATPSKALAQQVAQAEGLPLKAIKSKSQLDKSIKEAGERLVVVFFSGNWCETCQGLKPIMRQLAGLNAPVVFYEVNVDDSEDTAEACDIVHIPTVQFYKLGKKVAEILDDSRESVEEKLKELK